MKRCVISPDRIRITRPGYDVDTSPEDGFLLHEGHIYSQPYFFQYIQSPIGHYTGSMQGTASVSVPVPPVTDNPVFIIYARTPSGQNAYPTIRSQGTGNNQSGFNGYISLDCSVRMASASEAIVTFSKGSAASATLHGCYLILMKGLE